MSEEKKTVTMLEAAAIFRQRFNDEMSKQANEYNGAELSREIIAQLNKDRHDVVWRLLGLENHWGKWEVDHCNGRKSPIVDMMTEAVQAEVKEWLNEAIQEVIAANRDKLKTQFRKALEKEFTELSQRRLWDHVNRAVGNLMEQIQKEVEAEFKEGVRNVSVEEAQREGPAGQADQT